MINWELLIITNIFRGFCLGFFWRLIKDTLYELIIIIATVVILSAIVFTQPVEFYKLITEEWIGYIFFFIGSFLGHIAGDVMKEKYQNYLNS